MQAKIIAGTKLGHVPTKAELDHFGGLMAGVCYLPNDVATLLNEPEEKTARRVNTIKQSGHHSPFGHTSFTLEFDDVPKIVAMALNNEQDYVTCEKSARYKRMALPQDEQEKYNKWLEIFEGLISLEYKEKCPQFFTDLKITKLAQENARYLTSVFTPTSMAYTLDYRQLNVLHALFDKEVGILKTENHPFAEKLAKNLAELNTALKGLGYWDEKLAANTKDRSLSLIHRGRPIVEQFGDVYATTYLGSFAQFAQAQRHRTLSYSMQLLDEPQFFVPPILEKYPNLVEEWKKDCQSLADHFPQGMLVKINEMGTLEKFILKAKERQCTMAQLEIKNQTTETGKKMQKALAEQNHPAADELEQYTHGSRCTFPDFHCEKPCGFKDGVTGERLI